jgi:hypothetical protein
MSQSAKPPAPQEKSVFAPRRGKAGAAGTDALSHAHAALARAGFHDATMVLRWPDIVGEGVARTALPVKFQQGPEGAVLTLKCEAGALVFLQHQTRAILAAVNSYAGAERIVRLRLVAGKLDSRAEPPSRNKRPDAAPPMEAPAPTLADALERLALLRRQGLRR